LNNLTFKVLTALFFAGIIGCSIPAEQDADTVTKPTVHQTTKLIYEYKGKGDRPKFQQDPSRKIDVIKVGRQTSSHLGMTVKGPCAFVDTYETAEIKFADGTMRLFSDVTLEGWAGYQAALVKVN